MEKNKRQEPAMQLEGDGGENGFMKHATSCISHGVIKTASKDCTYAKTFH